MQHIQKKKTKRIIERLGAKTNQFPHFFEFAIVFDTVIKKTVLSGMLHKIFYKN